MSAAEMGFGEFPPSRKWRSCWIAAPGDPAARNAYYLFRKEIDLQDVPDALRMFICADTRYYLFVNGTYIGQGPPKSQTHFQYYDERDVQAHFTQGVNCVGVLVFHAGVMDHSRAGLLVEMVDGDGRVVLSSDTTWRAKRSEAWEGDTLFSHMNRTFAFQEHFDATKMPPAWDRPGFDDSRWPDAVWCLEPWEHAPFRPPAQAPWVYLVPRDIPFMALTPATPMEVAYTEECTDLQTRGRTDDVSISLAAAGVAIDKATCENPEALTQSDGACVLQCSTLHEDHEYGAIHDPCVVLDFGKVITAYPQVDVEGVRGAVLEIGAAERLVDGKFNNAIECSFCWKYTMLDGPQNWTATNWISFRYLKIRLKHASKPVKLHAVRGVITTYPHKKRGAFRSSDETLNKVWDISQYTLRLCSNEFLMDTPFREQAQWLGDVAAVTVGGLYACFGDTALAGKFYRQTGAGQRPTGLLSNVSNEANDRWERDIVDYSLWWIMGLWRHYLYTGQARWVHELYPEAVRVLQSVLRYVNERGLIEDMSFWTFIDWAPLGRRGECAALNAVFYGALETLGKMARFKGDDYQAAKIDTLRDAMKSGFHERFWDAKRQCYIDCVVDGKPCENVSEHANVAAIRFGLCDEQTAETIVRTLFEAPTFAFTECEPFFASVTLEALDRIGRTDLALKVIRDRWGKRMVDQGRTSVTEEWSDSGSWRDGDFHGFMRTHSHAWSAAPAEFLIRNLMGLEVLEPGCAKVRLAPRAADFDYEATYPTPPGPITVTCTGGKISRQVPPGVEVVS